MSPKTLFRWSAGASVWALASGAAALAQDLTPDSGFWIRTGGFLRGGMKVDFRDTAVPTPAGAGLYANGFVLPSVSTNSAYTWNWGYQDASQISGSTLQFNRLDGAPRVGGLSADFGAVFGGEVRGGFEVVRFPVGKREMRFGFEAGYGYGTLSASASGSAAGSATYQTAQYSLIDGNGDPIVPPGAPYAGTFNGPGPLIPLEGSVQTVTRPGTSTTALGIDSDLHVAKFGPYFELPLSKRFLIGVSFGYCTVLADAELTVRESTTYVDSIPGTQVNQAFRRSDWQPGGYFELRAQYDLTRHIGLYLGVEYEFNEDVTFGGAGRTATIKMGGVYGGVAGVRWTF
jgi:hypothetical protein